MEIHYKTKSWTPLKYPSYRFNAKCPLLVHVFEYLISDDSAMLGLGIIGHKEYLENISAQNQNLGLEVCLFFLHLLTRCEEIVPGSPDAPH